MTELATVKFVDFERVVITLVWPKADQFVGEKVAFGVLCLSREYSTNHGFLTVEFFKAKHPSPPIITVASCRTFDVQEKTKVLASTPEVAEITHARSKIRSADGYCCSELKVLASAESNESLSSLRAEIYLQFYEKDAQSSITLSFDLLKLYESQEGVDVTFTFQGETRELKAHKMILCARSEVLRGLLSTEMREALSGKIHINDASSTDFEKVLRYLYSGTLPNMVDIEEWFSCLKLADKYLLEELKAISEDEACMRLSRENVGKAFAISQQISCDDLRDESLRLLRSMKEKDRWRCLIDTGSHELMNLFVAELEKWEASNVVDMAVLFE